MVPDSISPAIFAAPATAAPDEMPANTWQSSSRRAQPLDRLAWAHDELPVEDVGVEDRRDEAVVEVAQALHELARRRLDRDDLHRRLLLLQVATHAHQRAARAEPGDEHVDLGAVAPDLGPGALVVRERVGGVAVLEQPHQRRVVGAELSPPRAGSRRCCPPRPATARPRRRRSRAAGDVRSTRSPASPRAAGSPRRCATSASPMPVLPDDGSRIVSPGCSTPSFSASSTIFSAMRSFDDPPGFWPSSLAKMRTSGFGDSSWMPTSGVLPMRPRTSS